MSAQLPFLPPGMSLTGHSAVNAAPDGIPPVWLYETCPSTLTNAADLAVQDALPLWGSVLASRQTQGRGQLGRHWISPAGNLYAAVRLPNCPPFSGSAAAPATGALLAALLAGLDLNIRIKWPNDLVLTEPDGDEPVRKVGGILIEERDDTILAGIGLNLHYAPSDTLMRADRALPAGCLPASVLRARGFCSVLDLWRYLVSGFRNQPLNRLAQNWIPMAEARLLGLGQTVILTEDADTPPLSGYLLGLDPSGGLRLETRQGILVLTSGSLHFPDTASLHRPQPV